MNFPPYVQPFDSTSDTKFIEAQLRACLYQCKQLELNDDACEKPAWVNDLAQLLSNTDFLLHRSQAVQQLTAHCHTYIMLSTINNVPYSPTRLVDVLQSLVDQLALLSDLSSSAYEERFEMFKTIGHKGLFVRIHPKVLQFGAIIYDLFHALYNAVSKNTGLIFGVQKFLSPILNSLESPEKTLDVIFAHLVPPLKQKEPSCYAVSKELMRKASPSLQVTIDTLLHGYISSHAHRIYEPISKETSAYLLHEVICVCPWATSLAFSQLAQMIKSQNDQERLTAVESLSYLASRRSLNMAPCGRYMLQLYLERCTDKSPRIRESCLRLSSSFLHCPEFAEDVLETLKQVQAGCGATVRHIVINSVTKAALKDSTIITDKLIDLLAANTHCASSEVRQEAISCLGNLYRSISLDRVCPKRLTRRISNVILEAYQTNSSDRMIVVQTYAQHLVPLSLSGSYRMELLYKLYCNLEAKSLKSFLHLHKNVREAQLHLRNTLDQVSTVLTSTPRRSSSRGTQLVEELRKDSVACSNLSNALSNQSSSDIASSRDAILKGLKDRRSRVLAEAQKLLWTATAAALSEDEFEQLLALVSEQKPTSDYSFTDKELQLFKVLSRTFPLSCGHYDYLFTSSDVQEQSEISEISEGDV